MDNMKRRGRPPSFDRHTVLRAAAHCFIKRGYEGSSIADLTSGMQISAQSLYAAFGTKASLFKEATNWYQTNVGKFVYEALAGENDPIRGLARVLFEAAYLFSEPTSPAGCLVSNSAIAMADENEDVASYAAEMRTAGFYELKSYITHAVQAGAIRSDVHVEGLARLLLSIRQGMSIQASDGASRESLLSIAETSVVMLENLRLPPRVD